MTNILHLEASSGWGGQEIRILREAEGLRRRGHSVVLGVMRGGQLISRARAEGFTVYELNFKRLAWPITLFRLIWIILSHRVNIVNTHSSLDSWIGGIAARITRRSIIRTRHLSTAIKKGFNSRFVYGKLADFVVTTCSSIIPMISSQSGKKVEKCRFVATGVNPDKIQVTQGEADTFRERMGIKKGDFLVGTACVMRSWKGINDLLQAANLLRDVPDLKWVVVGGGHMEGFMKKAKEMRLENIVQFTGHLDNPFPALAAFDVFTLLSTAHEGVSQAILQAAYLQKPLIATETGGLCEVCIDQITGFQVDLFSPRQVAEAVLLLKNDSSLREKMGKKGKELVEERFTYTHMLDQMEEIITNMYTSV